MPLTHAIRAYNFFCLILRFSYDLGKGPARIVSDRQVRINQWNRLQVYRNGISGYIVLNGVRVNGASPPGLSQLNLDTDMYLGGGGEKVSTG